MEAIVDKNIKRFLLYGHGGSYNHGAEAIVKTTIGMIRKKYGNDAYIAISSHFPEQDKEYLIDADEFFSPTLKTWEKEKLASSKNEIEQLARDMYAAALNFISPDTVCLSVGGDNFCYPNWHRLAVFQQEAVQKNAKSILWGCSIEPSAITSEMEVVLKSYTHILARESKTYNALHSHKITTVIQLLPDPAFILRPEPVELPGSFEAGNVVGINISPLIMRKEVTPGIVRENISNLIDYVLSETEMSIALIPHVVMPMDNDYAALFEIEQSVNAHFRSRVWLVDRKLSAAQLKSVISKCRFLICARTHASIAAYSTGIPTLVAGYSVKAIGIAEDLGVGEFVIDVTGIKSPDLMKNMFQRLCMKADDVRSVLAEKQEGYIQKVNDYLEYL
jgi:polysaccharide pyruvyl transferase WcaK-like protein